MKATTPLLLLLLILSADTTAAPPADLKPKCGPRGAPRATPISISNECFRSPKHPAPDFWALVGYYVPQINECCFMKSRRLTPNFHKTAQLIDL